MKFLLDENFPLALYRSLSSLGMEVEHIITLGKRGMPDSEIRQRLVAEDIVFLTQDTEFETPPGERRGTVIISRVRQGLPIRRRVEIWSKALVEFAKRRPAGKLFDLLETGEIISWEEREGQ